MLFEWYIFICLFIYFFVGWGTTSPRRSNVRMQVEVPIVSRSTCKHAYSGYRTIDNSMICAGYAEGGKDSCAGDSGGPMVCDEDNKFFLEGVVSWGRGCARPGFYGVYANVRHFKDWIESIMSNN